MENQKEVPRPYIYEALHDHILEVITPPGGRDPSELERAHAGDSKSDLAASWRWSREDLDLKQRLLSEHDSKLETLGYETRILKFRLSEDCSQRVDVPKPLLDDDFAKFALYQYDAGIRIEGEPGGLWRWTLRRIEIEEKIAHLSWECHTIGTFIGQRKAGEPIRALKRAHPFWLREDEKLGHSGTAPCLSTSAEIIRDASDTNITNALTVIYTIEQSDLRGGDKSQNDIATQIALTDIEQLQPPQSGEAAIKGASRLIKELTGKNWSDFEEPGVTKFEGFRDALFEFKTALEADARDRGIISDEPAIQSDSQTNSDSLI